MIRLSLVTVVYNDIAGLKRTISSVDSLANSISDPSCIEHIIIDGGSNDGSEDFLRSLIDFRPIRTVIVSEPDNGIYDAMNKGVRRSSGSGVLFLNAGDQLHPECSIDLILMELADLLRQPNEAGLAYCAILKIGRREVNILSRRVQLNRPKMPGSHQAMLYKRSVLAAIPFDSDFEICGDYDNFARIVVQAGYFRPINRLLSVFYAGGVSSRRPFRLLRESYWISVNRFKLSLQDKFLVLSGLVISLVIFQLLLFWGRVIGDSYD